MSGWFFSLNRGFLDDLDLMITFYDNPSLYDGRIAFWTLFHRFGNFVVSRDDSEKPLESLFEKAFFHVLVTAPEEQVNFDPVTFG